MTQKEQQDLDLVFLEELDVEEIKRFVIATDRGNLYLHWDGVRYYFIMNDRDYTSKSLLDLVPKFLSTMTR